MLVQPVKPEVFVLVPSYNHAPFIERCLKSIIKQTFQPTKLLVIDDGSNDDSAKIIETVLRDCPFSSDLIVRENRGLCATLNEGFTGSSGKYFAYLGSDDVWLPKFLENRVRLLENRVNAILGYGNAFLIDEYDCVIDCSADWGIYPDGDARPMLFSGTAPLSSTVLYRRSAIINTQWNEQSKLEDYDFYLRLFDNGDFAFDREVLSAWRLHDHNTSDDLSLMLSECLSSQERHLAELAPKELEAVHNQTKLHYLTNFLRKGRKKSALTLIQQDWRVLLAANHLERLLLRFLAPSFLIRYYQAQRKKKYYKRYGKIMAFDM